MKRIFLIPVFALLCLTAAERLRAQESGAFLKVPLSPQAGGMGDAFAAVADGPLGLYYNPAGMVFMKRQAVSLVYHTYLQDISGNSLAFVSPFRNWAAGTAPVFFSMKQEPVYDSMGNDTGASFTYKRSIIPLAFAYRLNDWGFGVTLKSYNEEIAGQASGTTAFDAGVMRKLGHWSFGLALQNYGGKVYDYDLVKIQRLGAAYSKGKYLLAADIKKEGEAGSFLSLGGAFSAAEAVKVRCGWRLKEEFGGPAFGLGLELGGLGFDYAFLGYGEFGNIHKAGLSLAFGPKAEERVKLKNFWNRLSEATGIAPEKTTRVRVAELSAQTVYSAAVADFAGKGLPPKTAAGVTGYFRAALAATGRFKVMDKKAMDTTLYEQKFESGGCDGGKCAVEMGRLLNVQMMFTGTLSKDADGYKINVEAVDTKTGRIAAFYEQKALLKSELKSACPKMLEKMFQSR